MYSTFTDKEGVIDLRCSQPYHNDRFGYTLFENVVDPRNPEGPKAIVMHVPKNSLSKAWLLVEPDYEETVELLEGSARLVLQDDESGEWRTISLTTEDPTGEDVVIKAGDIFSFVTEDEDAVILSRPSIEFDIKYEAGVTTNPEDALSRFILANAMWRM